MNVLLFIIKIPHYILDVILLVFDAGRYKKIVKKPFVCPNCGSTFFAKWYHLFQLREVTLITTQKAKLKCPHCKETDMCRWMNEEQA